MSKRCRDDNEGEALPDRTMSAARVKRDDDDATAIPDDEVVVTPKLGRAETILMVELLAAEADTVENAARDLNRMCDFSYASNLVLLGAHVVILQTMQKWGKRENILVVCMECLAQLCKVSANAPSKHVLSLGGMEMVITAMKRFPESHLIQDAGCCALASIVKPNAVIRFVQELEGVPLIVSTMAKFPENWKIQSFGCGVLRCIAREHQLRKTIIKESGASAATKALERDFGVKTTQVHFAASKFMKSLFA